jgi:hypothetical protein
MRLTRPLVSIALGACLLAASAAHAGEVLKLKDGKLIPGTVKAVDGDQVTFSPEKGGSMQVPWSQVYPINRYELWKSTLAADDAEGRVKLARWTLEAGFFVYARREIAEARGLGYADTKALDGLLASVNKTEADTALAEIDGLIETGKLNAALSRVTRYVRDSEDPVQQKRVRSRVPDIVQRIERHEELVKEQATQKKKDAKAARKDAWIKSSLVKANKAKAAGKVHAIGAFTYLAQGNQTRARRGLKRAESEYVDARDLYRKVRKVAGEGETATLCKREMDICDQRLLEILRRWGALEVKNKSWRRASAAVDRGLRVDPVDRELLDLRKVIDENWIRRKLSGITNATGR